MLRKLTSTHILTALVAGIIAIPTMTTGYIIRPDSRTSTFESDMQRKAFEDQTGENAIRRRHENAIKNFEQREASKKSSGTGADALMNGSLSIEGEVAQERKLSAEDRKILRQYVNEGFCPASMRRSTIKGFYELCIKLAAKNAAPNFRTGYLLQQPGTHNAAEDEPTSSFKLRMEMLKQAMDRSNRRDTMKPSPSLDRVHWWEKDIDE